MIYRHAFADRRFLFVEFFFYTRYRNEGIGGAHAFDAFSELFEADDTLFHHVRIDDQLGVGADAGAPGLQQKKLIVFDGEFDVKVVLELVFENVFVSGQLILDS